MNKIQEIFKLYEADYLRKFRPNSVQKKFLNDIRNCKTVVNGYHLYKCDHCQKTVYAGNPCNNRHCPVCGDYKEEMWKEKHYMDLLDVKYLHVVLGVPNEMRAVFYYNQIVGYNILLESAAESIKLVNPHLKLGVIAMLHTWSQKMNYHPHVHLLITKGGLNYQGKWDTSVNVNIDLIKNYFLKRVIRKLKHENLSFFNKLSVYNTNYLDYLESFKSKKWISYIKEPFSSPKNVIDYLSKYTFKVAITEDRIVSYNNKIVVFKYRDYRSRDIQRTYSYDAREFIRKFLMHILPKGFVKIRYYGLYATRGKNKRLETLKNITRTTNDENIYINKLELLKKMTNLDVTVCKNCKGKLVLSSSKEK